MASMIFDRFFANLVTKQIGWTADSIMVALIDSTYTPSKGDSLWVTGRDPFDSEVVGAGYTHLGKALSSKTVTTVGDTTRLSGDSIYWTASTVTARYAVFYDGTATAKNLLWVFDFGSDKASSSGTFTLVWNAIGIATLQQG
jgi:hypothetical protein